MPGLPWPRWPARSPGRRDVHGIGPLSADTPSTVLLARAHGAVAEWYSFLLDMGEAAAMEASGYGRLWSPADEREARQWIYNTDNPEGFETGGQSDADRLCRWIATSDVVLDLGCGIGRIAKYVAPRCSHLWAVDVSSQMLAMASKRLADLHNISYVRCQETTFSGVPSESVDVAYAVLVLQHVEREDAFLLLEELHRVLRPGGRLIVTYPNLLSEVYLQGFISYAHAGASTEVTRARIYTPQEVERLLPAAGFDVELDLVGSEIWANAKKVREV